MYPIKRFVNNWEYLKGSFPEFPMQQRIFHSILMVSILAGIFSVLWAFLYQPSTGTLLILLFISAEIPIFYYSRFKKAFKRSYILWIVLSHIFIVAIFFTQGGLNISLWNLFIVIFFTTALIAQPRHHLLWFLTHSSLFIILVFIEYYHHDLISNTYYSKELFYAKVLYSSVATFAVLQIYTNFVIINYTNKRKKLECQRAESELRGERLKEMNEQKNKLISVIAHDFNTPLNNIKRYLNLMQQVELDNERKKLLEKELLLVTIDTQNLLANLLTWSKNNMEGIQFSPEIVNVNDAIVYTKDLYNDIAKEKNIQLTYQIENNVHVMGNYEMIDIIIRNFISNAIKFTAEGGKVHVSALREYDRYKLVVIDNGTGFHESQLQKLFVSTIESTPGTRQEKGAGIGLSIAKEFAEMMNGSIGFRSQLGQGTEFYIYLPAVDYQENKED